MSETYQIKCPCCETILVVERVSGKIVEERRPIREDSSGDRFDDAMRNVRERKGVLEKKVAEAQAAEKSKSARLDDLFNKGLERAKEEGPIKKPRGPLDFD